MEKINMQEKRKVVDIGCGKGNQKKIIVERWKDEKIQGFDKQKEMIEKEKKNMKDVELLISDEESLEKDEEKEVLL